MFRPLDRRTFLKSAGVSLALPMLDAMRPAMAANAAEAPRRMVAICTNLGVLEEHFYPEQTGRGFELTPYLEQLTDFREQFTVISGASHPHVAGGHSAEVSYLTAAPRPGGPSFRNSISLDQLAAQHIGHYTRVPALPLVVAKKGNQSLSFTSGGVMLPAERSPAEVFKALFVEGDPQTIEKRVEELRSGRSILDILGDRATTLKKTLGGEDRERMDQYFTAVREVEKRLMVAEAWERQPKPKVDVPAPTDGEYLLDKLRSMYQLIRLALATDSTRLVTLMIRLDGFSAHIPGVSGEAHNPSHHVGRADALEQLKNLEMAQFRELSELLKSLDETEDDNGSLLDQTMVLYGSNLGNGNNHDTKNMPILLAGGGFRHGQHLAFDRKDNYPLPRLYVSMLQRLGIEADAFASSTGTMTGLDMASAG